MQLSDYYPVLVTVSLIVGAIIALRVFFSLWGPVDRFLNGGARFVFGKGLNINELKDKRVNIQLKGNTTIAGVVLLGICPANPQAPYFLRQLFSVRFADGRLAYVRVDEIAYFEEENQTTP